MTNRYINNDVKDIIFYFLFALKNKRMASTTQNSSETQDDSRLLRQLERRQLRLGKRLAYLLRYGAEKEGLRVDEGK